MNAFTIPPTMPGSAPSQLRHGTVVATADGEVRVQADRVFCARRATGCLVEPAIDDLVLISVVGGQAFVLTVLDREPDAPVCLSAGDDVELSAARLRLRGQRRLELSGEELASSSKRLSVQADEARVTVKEGTLVGRLLRRHADKVETFARRVDAIADHLVQRIGRSYRHVEKTEHVRAGRIDLRADETLTMRGRHTLMTAQELVKVDAAQIHVG